MFSGLCRSHSILHPQCVSKLIDIFDILFQTRVKMYHVPSLNSSTMTMCRLCASIFALSRSGTGTGGGDIEPGIVLVVFFIKRDATYHQCSLQRPPRPPPPRCCRQGPPTAVLQSRPHPWASQGSCWQGQCVASLQTGPHRGGVRFLCETLWPGGRYLITIINFVIVSLSLSLRSK